jgi:hypothetical protein
LYAGSASEAAEPPVSTHPAAPLAHTQTVCRDEVGGNTAFSTSGWLQKSQDNRDSSWGGNIRSCSGSAANTGITLFFPSAQPSSPEPACTAQQQPNQCVAPHVQAAHGDESEAVLLETSCQLPSVRNRVLARQQTWFEKAGMLSTASAAQNSVALQQFLLRFGYMVDDLLSVNPEVAVDRARLAVLSFYLVSAVQHCVTAIFFGLYHFYHASMLQIAVLLAVHVSLLVYLIAIRPYATCLLLVSDIAAYMCEIVVLLAAMLLLKHPYNTTLPAVLTGCYFVNVVMMVLPELIRILLQSGSWIYRIFHKQPPQQLQKSAHPADPNMTDLQASPSPDANVLLSKSLSRRTDTAAERAAVQAMRLDGS